MQLAEFTKIYHELFKIPFFLHLIMSQNHYWIFPNGKTTYMLNQIINADDWT